VSSDPLALAKEATEGLTDGEKTVAEWIASPFALVEGEKKRKTADMVAEELGVDRGTVYRWAKRPEVRHAAHELMAASLDTEKLPQLWDKILEEAQDDPKGFGLKVARALMTAGFSPFGTVAPSGGATSINLPAGAGSYEALIAVRRTDG
jgi:hypothetical protein